MAVDPMTLKMAAKAATAIFTDEKARQRMVIIYIVGRSRGIWYFSHPQAVSTSEIALKYIL